LRARQACAKVGDVNPLLALGLLAAVGLLATRLPRPPVRRSLGLDPAFAAGAPLLLLGLVLGPGIGLLSGPVLRALAPATALAIGWIGAVFGSRFEWRYVRRIPGRVWLLAAGSAVAVLAVVALGAAGLERLIPALAAEWTPRVPALLAIAAVAAMSGPGVVALVAQALGIRRSVARVVGSAAALETALGALAMTVPFALHHPLPAARTPALGWLFWTAFAVGSGGLVGLVFLSLTRPSPPSAPVAEDIGLALFGSLLFGAGIGYGAGLSPFLVCALATALIVNWSPQRRRARTLLAEWGHPVYVLLLIAAGALLTPPTLWIVVAAVLLGSLRVAARWTAGYLGRPLFRGLARSAPDAGIATVAQGGAALALGIDFFLTYAREPGGRGAGPGGAGGAGGPAVLATIILGVALAQLVAPLLTQRALRLPRAALAPAPAVELSSGAPAD